MREKRKRRGFVLWFTGLPKAGKTTIADGVFRMLKEKRIKAERLDGDIVRQGLSSDLGFSKEDRDKNIARVTFVAKLLSRNGIAVVASFISPYRHQRKMVRNQVTNFIEVFVNTPLEVCEARDKDGLYKKAREGKIKNFTGISDPYEEPEDPGMELKADRAAIEESVKKIMEYLSEIGYI